ncbi:amidohydrolase family protein [Archangium lansingense]|uniref:Amidohydrolase family protein n=1 Tax=Archangium lansingense TaxID=2995310 RepID=A0ABT4ACQ6_9BACT|nr:amidohydrolase family protein [Archangium lansinium]MCY1079442.1 amidohydrolase family protein [Archangium lansinium]
MKPSSSAAPASNQVIDTHCHIASLDFIPPEFVDGIVSNIELALDSQGVRAAASKVREVYLAKLQDPLCDELVSEMDGAEIDHAVLLAPDFTYALKGSRLTIEEILLHHKTVYERHQGRFSVFAGVDPRWGKDGIDLFERSIRDFGFHGLKVYPPCGFPGSDPQLYPYYEICARWHVPVLVHIGGTCPALAFDTASPVQLDEAARNFPRVNFILAHGSVSYVEECAMMCSFRPNVYLDVSGFQTAELVALEQLLRRGFKHKVLFGTDWPLFRLQGSQNECLAKLKAEGGPLEQLRNHELRAFFGGTVAKLLGTRSDPTQR